MHTIIGILVIMQAMNSEMKGLTSEPDKGQSLIVPQEMGIVKEIDELGALRKKEYERIARQSSNELERESMLKQFRQEKLSPEIRDAMKNFAISEAAKEKPNWGNIREVLRTGMFYQNENTFHALAKQIVEHFSSGELSRENADAVRMAIRVIGCQGMPEAVDILALYCTNEYWEARNFSAPGVNISSLKQDVIIGCSYLPTEAAIRAIQKIKSKLGPLPKKPENMEDYDLGEHMFRTLFDMISEDVDRRKQGLPPKYPGMRYGYQH